MSEDAKEGIELMHEMTKAVTWGNNTDSSFLFANLTPQPINPIDKHHLHDPHRPSSSTCDVLYPLLSVSKPNDVNCESNSPILNKKKIEKSPKYPNLEKFLSKFFLYLKFYNNFFSAELRSLYENFLDSMHTPEFVQTLVDKINYEKVNFWFIIFILFFF